MKELAWMRLLAVLLDKEGSGSGEGAVDDDEDDDGPDLEPGDVGKQLKEWQTYAKRLRKKDGTRRIENKYLKSELAAATAEIEALKKAAEAFQSSSSSATPPKPVKAGEGKRASDMTREEYDAAKAQFVGLSGVRSMRPGRSW